MLDDFRPIFNNKNILITGGGGYLAASIFSLLRDVECKIISIDRPGHTYQVPDGKAIFETISLDIREDSIWAHLLEGIEIVFHFAAQTSVYKANENPSADLESNVLPMVHLLEMCEKERFDPIILFSGTVTETGLPDKLPVDETRPDSPVTIYDLHKLMAENYLKYYIRQGRVRGTILRLANVYGPGPPGSSADRGVLNMMIRRAIGGEALTVYGQGDFLRDYVFVEDVAKAFLFAVGGIDAINGQHFVIGSGEGYSIFDAFSLVADRVAEKISRKVPVICVEPPDQLNIIETRNFVADSSNFSSHTGWQPKYTLPTGIDRTLESFL